MWSSTPTRRRPVSPSLIYGVRRSTAPGRPTLPTSSLPLHQPESLRLGLQPRKLSGRKRKLSELPPAPARSPRPVSSALENPSPGRRVGRQFRGDLPVGLGKPARPFYPVKGGLLQLGSSLYASSTL